MQTLKQHENARATIGLNNSDTAQWRNQFFFFSTLTVTYLAEHNATTHNKADIRVLFHRTQQQHTGNIHSHRLYLARAHQHKNKIKQSKLNRKEHNLLQPYTIKGENIVEWKGMFRTTLAFVWKGDPLDFRVVKCLELPGVNRWVRFFKRVKCQ